MGLDGVASKSVAEQEQDAHRIQNPWDRMMTAAVFSAIYRAVECPWDPSSGLAKPVVGSSLGSQARQPHPHSALNPFRVVLDPSCAPTTREGFYSIASFVE